jgi:hypothetical protein
MSDHTSIFKVLVIGDPHFKADNALETDLMTLKLVDLVLQEQPDFTVVLGDTLHTHDLVRLDPLCRATDFFRKLRDVNNHLYVLIGNHDRPNNACYLTSDHPFNSLKDWRQTTVVDRVQTATHVVRSIGKKVAFTFAPYVPVGRFAEALLTVGLSTDPTADTAIIPLKQMSSVFAHQEFKWAKMGAIVSEHGDPWPIGAPLCVSGHVHDYDELCSNLVYSGTPIQHGYADKPDKTVSILHFKLAATREGDPSSIVTIEAESGRIRSEGPSASTDSTSELVQLELHRHQRVSLGIPPKIHIRLTPEQLTVYTPPTNAHVKITVEGDPDVIRQVLALDHVKALSMTHGIKIVILDTRRSGDTKGLESGSQIRGSTPFRVRLHNALSLEPAEVQSEFARLFGSIGKVVPQGNGITPRTPSSLKVSTPSNLQMVADLTPVKLQTMTSVKLETLTPVKPETITPVKTVLSDSTKSDFQTPPRVFPRIVLPGSSKSRRINPT